MPAGDRLRVEARQSTISALKKVRIFLGYLFLVLITGPSTWPPVDVVLVDQPTGRTLKVWQESGSEATLLIGVLKEDLAKMTLGEFVENWHLPPV